MKISDAGLAFIAKEEGYVAHVYLDVVGVATIGYGHVVKAGETLFAIITEPEARALLRRDAQAAEEAVNEAVEVPLTQPQFDALVSLVFNVGPGEVMNERTSTLLRLLNAGDYGGAAKAFAMWRMGGGRVLPVLVARRAREAALFNSAATSGTTSDPDMRDPNRSEIDNDPPPDAA